MTPPAAFSASVVDGVTVCVHPSPSARGDHSLLRESVGATAAVDPALVTTVSRCARCGSTGHGRPEVLLPRGHGEWFVSIARTPGVEVHAITTLGPVGIDVETVARVARAPLDAAFHEAELATLATVPSQRGNRMRTLIWSAKEAILKATGRGLHTDPALLAVDVRDEAAIRLLLWPEQLGLEHPPLLSAVEPHPGTVAVVALIAPPGHDSAGSASRNSHRSNSGSTDSAV